MKYSDYQVSDFLKDDFFVKWVKDNDQHANDFWERWIETHPEKTQTIAQAKEIIISIQYKEKYELSSDEYVSLYEEIIKKTAPDFHNSTLPKYSYYLKRIAASLILLAVVFSVVWITTIPKPTKESITQNTSLTINKATLPGEKLSFKLPDGTIVKLNAASTLKFFQADDNSQREVFLEGEAFFDVAKDVNRPFIVKTKGMSTTALGTSFNASAYSMDNSHKISLLTGRIIVEKTSEKGNKNSNILLPGDQIIYSRANDNFEKVHFDIEQEMAWSNGVIIFEDTDFKNVIITLERWYGVQFEIINENKKTKDAFSGVFENQSLERVLEILSFSGDFTFKLNDSEVIIEFMNKN